MRADRLARLVALAVLCAAAPAHGQNPETDWVCGSGACQPGQRIEVPEPSCQCGPNGEWVKCSQCTGEESTPGSTSTQQRPPQGVPPIVKLAVGAVAGAIVVGAFAVAPGHMTGAFTKTQSGRQAREAWNEERAKLAALEYAGKQAQFFRGELDGAVRLAETPPAVRLERDGAYEPIASPPPPDAWSPNGACTQILASHDAALERAQARANAQARAQLPTVQGLVKQAKSEALSLVARKVGAEKLLAHGKALHADYKRAKEYDAFIQELVRCVEARLVDPTNDCELVIYDRVNAELKAFLDEFQAGAGDAHERVRQTAAFFRGYVNDLERSIERHAALVARCR